MRTVCMYAFLYVISYNETESHERQKQLTEPSKLINERRAKSSQSHGMKGGKRFLSSWGSGVSGKVMASKARHDGRKNVHALYHTIMGDARWHVRSPVNAVFSTAFCSHVVKHVQLAYTSMRACCQ